jgi:hypothetical protein
MNFRLSSKHYFRVEERRSEDQLTMDFGEFSPFPLNCSKKESVVTIVHAAGFGSFFNCIQISSKQYFVSGAGAKASLHTSIPAELAEHGGMELIKLLNQATLRFPRFLRPLTARVFRILVLLFYSRILSRIINRRENGLAVFFPTGAATGHISLADAAMNLKKGNEAILSHEHLHFLQHIDGERIGKEVKNLGAFIPAKDHNNGTLLYILERREVEARLHEMVLSYYRATKILPLDPESFLDILFASPSFHGGVIVPLQMEGYFSGKDVQRFTERDEMFPEQLAMAFAYMTDRQIEYRYITEVLVVMYGNLLRYYGDENASKRYLAKLMRPNLYDILYGEKSLAE